MYIVKDDNPDVPFTIAFTVTDAEGNAVAASELNIETTSDNDSCVSVIDDPAGDALKGTLHFGAPGTANVNVEVSNKTGTLLGSLAAAFTVTTGEPSAIAGGTIAFEGLTES